VEDLAFDLDICLAVGLAMDLAVGSPAVTMDLAIE
jgi:hypothetical protein